MSAFGNTAMSSSVSYGQEGSDVSNENERERVDERARTGQSTCPECDSRVVEQGIEAVCTDCGLVVAVEAVVRAPTLQAQAPSDHQRTGEWAVETVTDLRVDNGLHTTFFLETDGYGKQLRGEQFEKWQRLRRRHKRFTMHSKRDKRLNEGLRDIQLLAANLGLPGYVASDAARYLRVAKAERLPGGKMAWESLAAGAVVLAARTAGFERTPSAVARYAKTCEERLCAAARKLRVQTDLELSAARERAVDRVVAALEDSVDVATGLELVRVAEQVLAVADDEPIGPGTARMTVAGAAVYVADRVTEGKALSQRAVVAAVDETVATSRDRIRRYSRQLRAVIDGCAEIEGGGGVRAGV